MDIVLGVSGGIGSGKTEFVTRVAASLQAVTVSFGGYVRMIAEQRGLPLERQVLQDLGENLLKQLGAEGFAGAVMKSSGGDRGMLVVDGVRHVEIADAIRRLVLPRKFVLVFLDVSEESRKERLNHGRPGDAQQLRELAGHSTERQVHDGTVRDRADLILDGTQSPETLVRVVLDALTQV